MLQWKKSRGPPSTEATWVVREEGPVERTGPQVSEVSFYIPC